MSVVPPLPQSALRWHVSKNETLSTYFGLEKRVLTIDELIAHQRSINQLNTAFESHRAYHLAEAKRREAFRPLPQRSNRTLDQPINLSIDQSTSGLGLNKKLYNFTETKRDDDDYKYSGSDLLDSPYKELSPSLNQSANQSVIVNNLDTSFNQSTRQSISKHSEFDPLYESHSYTSMKDATILVPGAVMNEDEQARGQHVNQPINHPDHIVHTIQPVAAPLDQSIDDQSLNKSNDQLLVANESLVEADKVTVLGTVPVDLPIAEPVDQSTHQATAMPLVDTALQLDEDNFAPPRARAHIEYVATDAFSHLGSAEPVDEDLYDESQPISAPQSSQVKSRTLQLADYHESIIAQEHAAALGVDPSVVKRSPIVTAHQSINQSQPEHLDLAPESHVARMKRLHDAEIAAEKQRKIDQDALFSGKLRATGGSAAPVAASRVAEMKRLHDEEIEAEKQRKIQQDALFSGQLKHAVAPVAAVGVSSRIAEIKRLHEEAALAEAQAKAQQDALFAGQLKHAPSQSINQPSSVSSSRIAEMKRLHEQAVIAEAEAKAKQDALFSGQLKHSTSQITSQSTSQSSRLAEVTRQHEEATQAEAAAKAKQDALFSGKLTLNQHVYERVVPANTITIPLNDRAPEPIDAQPVDHADSQSDIPVTHAMNVDNTTHMEQLDEPVQPVEPVKKLRVSDMAKLHDDEIAAEKERKAHQDALFSGQLRRESGNSQTSSNEIAARISDMKRLHEEAAHAEAAAKAQQDALFSGQLRRESGNAPVASNEMGSSIANMKQLHEQAAIAEAEAKAKQDALFSGQLKRKSTENISPSRAAPSSRIAEMKTLHEQAAQAEAEAKAKQDALFSGQLKHTTSEPRSVPMTDDNVVHIPLNDEPVAAVPTSQSTNQSTTQQKQPTPKGKSNRKKNRR